MMVVDREVASLDRVLNGDLFVERQWVGASHEVDNEDNRTEEKLCEAHGGGFPKL